MKLRYPLSGGALYAALCWLVARVDMRPEHAAALALAFTGVALALLVTWLRTATFRHTRYPHKESL